MRLYETMENGTYIIAEMSANHAGSIENAKKSYTQPKRRVRIVSRFKPTHRIR